MSRTIDALDPEIKRCGDLSPTTDCTCRKPPNHSLDHWCSCGNTWTKA